MDKIIAALVDTVVVPLADAVPILVASGALLVVFAAIWAAFGIALVRDRARLDVAWRRVRGLPLPVEAIVWLLLMPVLVGLWIWRRGWPLAARLTLIGGLAGWNLLVFVPRPA